MPERVKLESRHAHRIFRGQVVAVGARDTLRRDRDGTRRHRERQPAALQCHGVVVCRKHRRDGIAARRHIAFSRDGEACTVAVKRCKIFAFIGADQPACYRISYEILQPFIRHLAVDIAVLVEGHAHHEGRLGHVELGSDFFRKHVVVGIPLRDSHVIFTDMIDALGQ